MALGENRKIEDMSYFELLAWLGIGSSHPGGFPATKQNLSVIEIRSEDHILDAGCGGGLTACYLAKNKGCKITGVDLNTEIIEKAKYRAAKEGVSHLVQFQVADVNCLPFPDNFFDLVIGESITVFLDKDKVFREFYRVLKPEGRIADLEMSLLKELPSGIRNQMEECFGANTKPLPYDEWRQTLSQAGFQDVEIKNPQPLKNNNNHILTELKKDWLLIKNIVEKAASQRGIVARLQKNAGFIKKNYSYYGFGLLYGRKPTPPPPKMNFKKWLQHFIFGKQ